MVMLIECTQMKLLKLIFTIENTIKDEKQDLD
jgi:hypothetical protein